MRTETEKRYKTYRELRTDGHGVGKAGEIMGVSRQTAWKFEQRMKSESLPIIAALIEKRLAEMLKNKEVPIDKLVKMADALSKIKAIQRKEN